MIDMTDTTVVWGVNAPKFASHHSQQLNSYFNCNRLTEQWAVYDEVNKIWYPIPDSVVSNILFNVNPEWSTELSKNEILPTDVQGGMFALYHNERFIIKSVHDDDASLVSINKPDHQFLSVPIRDISAISYSYTGELIKIRHEEDVLYDFTRKWKPKEARVEDPT